MSTVTSQSPLNTDKARFNMIEQQVRPWEVVDSKVLELMTAVRREDFVPAVYRNLAFADLDVPMTQPAQAGLCMLAPKVQARLLQDAAVQPTDTVLHIGTGTGYMAALLGKQAKQVLSLEIVPELAAQARQNLQQAGITNVDVREADAAAWGFKACEALLPYNVIVLSGSVAEVPQDLLMLLKVGGRLIAVVGHEPIMRATIVTRVSDTSYATVQPWDYVAPRLKNFPEGSTFRF
jgi:protein-L-isoaspartate(D-aspartate) O-methyltransferase